MSADIESILKEVLDAIGLPYKGITRGEIAGQTVFSIESDDGRQLIGMHGDTIHAIDHIVKKIAEQRSAPKERDLAVGTAEREPMVLIDVNDYRGKQIKELQMKAVMMAERARSFQYDVELSPMSAYERLIIHTALQGAPHVKTESQGEGRNRRVVIKYSAE
jgi:spoIIIJ-associated protein